MKKKVLLIKQESDLAVDVTPIETETQRSNSLQAQRSNSSQAQRSNSSQAQRSNSSQAQKSNSSQAQRSNSAKSSVNLEKFGGLDGIINQLGGVEGIMNKIRGIRKLISVISPVLPLLGNPSNNRSVKKKRIDQTVKNNQITRKKSPSVKKNEKKRAERE